MVANRLSQLVGAKVSNLKRFFKNYEEDYPRLLLTLYIPMGPHVDVGVLDSLLNSSCIVIANNQFCIL